MTDETPQESKAGTRAAPRKEKSLQALREDRLKAALKANMARRKAQNRARAAGLAESDPPEGDTTTTDNQGADAPERL
jgi:hypothetical protein